MKLYVMRHGAAEDEAASHLDFDRALTAAGRERVRRVAMTLLEGGEEPRQVVTSPLVRAVQTAEIVALVTGLGDRGGTLRARREIAPSGDLVGLVRRLVAEGEKRTMVVGHEPDLSALIAALAGPLRHPFEKAMIVGVHLGGGDTGKVRFVLDPKALRLQREEASRP